MFFFLVNAFRLSSVPEPGQLHRYRAAPRGSMLAMVPVDGAEFLAGQHFDVSVELHSFESFPTILPNITINSIPIEKFWNFNATVEQWTFPYFKDMESRVQKQGRTVHVSRLVFRSVSIQNPGHFHVVIKAGNESMEADWAVRAARPRTVKNLILFIGDGMAPSMISAARYISKPTVFGKFGSNFLEFEKLGAIGKIATNGIDSMLTDSANSAAAYMSGHKGWVNSLNVYSDTSEDSLDDPKVETLAEMIRRYRPGMCIGVVTTAAVQDATPASVHSHTRSRSDYEAITHQMIHPFTNQTWAPKPVKVDVLMGGGGQTFCTNELCKGKTDYFKAYQEQGYTIVKSKTDLLKYNGTGPLLGIFTAGHLDTWLDRTVYKENLALSDSDPDGKGGPNTDQPGLVDMTMKAIQVMESKCQDGFFLLSEASAVDKSMHALDYDRGLADLLELDAAVKAVKKWAGQDTGIIVTADHAQGFDVYGSVDVDYFNKQPDDEEAIQKRFAVGDYGDAGWPDLVLDDNNEPTQWKTRFRLASGKVDSLPHKENFQLHTPEKGTNPLTRMPSVIDEDLSTTFNTSIAVENEDEQGLHYKATLPNYETHSVHTLQAVDIYCGGPSAFRYACSRVMDNTELFYIMADALGVGHRQGYSKNKH